jgi:hypothetical protein
VTPAVCGGGRVAVGGGRVAVDGGASGCGRRAGGGHARGSVDSIAIGEKLM